MRLHEIQSRHTDTHTDRHTDTHTHTHTHIHRERERQTDRQRHTHMLHTPFEQIKCTSGFFGWRGGTA